MTAEILARQVAHDRGRALVELLAVGRVQVIGLEAVRQAEDGLAAVMLEAVLALRAKRMLEQALLAAIAGEVVRGPEIARTRRMPLDHAVVLADAGQLEARTLRDEPLDVAFDVDAFAPSPVPGRCSGSFSSLS